LVRQAGYSYSIYWEVDTLDWQFPGVEAEVNKVLTKGKNGSIVLMHLNVPDSATASDQLIPQLRAQGYKLVTVSQVMKCQ
ncbi:MAG TPA: polysaccharide deacetylase, partial [Symbiobacteriaceae bacterium]|nr:polysaccharide deacetylase [Symbiobacteriaceae bacterium]